MVSVDTNTVGCAMEMLLLVLNILHHGMAVEQGKMVTMFQDVVIEFFERLVTCCCL